MRRDSCRSRATATQIALAAKIIASQVSRAGLANILGLTGDVEGMLLHSADYLDLFSTLVIGWQWLAQAAAAKEGLATADSGDDTARAFYRGKLSAAQYWIQSELPRIGYLAALCKSGEDSYRSVHPDWF